MVTATPEQVPHDSCEPAAPAQPGVQVEENISLAPYTTLRIGGPARFFATIRSEPDLLAAIRFARERNLPVYALGGGSNLLVSDRGFPGMILHLALAGSLERHDEPASVLYDVPAGVDWDAFVLATCEAGLSGAECLAGIPGLVGGSPIQNIGAYGQEVAETIVSVRTFDLTTHSFRTFPAAECGFAYRRSRFNSTEPNRYLVTSVAFRFDRQARPRLTYAELQQHFAGRPDPTPLQVYTAVRTIRHRKGMLLGDITDPDTRSAGSFFKNPIVPAAALDHIARELSLTPAQVPHWPVPGGLLKLPAAWLIEQSGFHKAFTLGTVGISSRHTLALINRTGTATCADLLRLRDAITRELATRFAIELEQEPVFLS